MASSSLAVTVCMSGFWGEGACPHFLGVCLYSAQETPDPWQSLDPFDSLDSKPFKKGNWLEVQHHPGFCC